MNLFKKRWSSFRTRNLDKTIPSLQYKYVSDNLDDYTPDTLRQAVIFRKNIAEALVFWLFIRNKHTKEDGDTVEVLKDFLAHRNPYIQIVARMESFPDELFQKLLWRGNMDFPSFEAFLRRLQPDQKDLIWITYEEFHGTSADSTATPTVYKMSLRDRAAFFFGRKSKKSILEGEWSSKSWQSRSAWAFNLLGLDFGFGLYPRGDNDDTKITNKKWTRFFSLKEHINDFVVNQFDGKYWALYRSARSNYVWDSEKKVKLKTYICPGFWWTFLVHLTFWVLSPLFFFFALKTALHYGHYFYWLLIASIFPTPLAAVFAGVKWIGVWLYDHFDPIENFVGKTEKRFAAWRLRHGEHLSTAAGIFAVAILLGIAGALCYGVWKVCTLCHVPAISVLLFGLALSFHIVWVVRNSNREKGEELSYSTIPLWIRLVSLFSLFLIFANIVEYLLEDQFEYLLNALWQSLSSFVRNNTWNFIGGLIGTVACVFSSVFISFFLGSDQARFAKNVPVIRVFSVFFIVTVGIAFFKDMNSHFAATTFSVLLHNTLQCIETLALLGCFLLFFAVIPVKECSPEQLARSNDFVKKYSYGSWFKWYLKIRLSKNSWLIQMSTNSKGRVYWKISDSFRNMSSYSYEGALSAFMYHYFPDINVERYVKLQKVAKLVSERYKNVFSEEQLLDIMKVIFTSSLSENMVIVLALRDRRLGKERIVRRTKRWRKFLENLTAMFWPPIWVVTRCYRFWATVIDLAKYFATEACPFVNQSKQLE